MTAFAFLCENKIISHCSLGLCWRMDEHDSGWIQFSVFITQCHGFLLLVREVQMEISLRALKASWTPGTRPRGAVGDIESVRDLRAQATISDPYSLSPIQPHILNSAWIPHPLGILDVLSKKESFQNRLVHLRERNPPIRVWMPPVMAASLPLVGRRSSQKLS